MGASRLYRLLIIIAMITAGCGGGSLEGGQSGTGIAAIVGNVAAVGGTGDVAQIQVTVEGSTVTGVTDPAGTFSLSGDVSGPEVLLFERERDGLRAEVEVVIPAGGRLELGDVEIEPEEGRAIPTRRFVEFEGVLKTADCASGELQVATRLKGVTAFFVLPLGDAFIHDAMDNPVPCAALSPGIEVKVKANVDDLGRLSNADVEIESELDDNGEEEEQNDQEQEDRGQDEGGQEDEQRHEDEEDSGNDEVRGDSEAGDELSAAELSR